MAKNILNNLLVFGLLLTTITVINGNLNVYLNLEEVIRLLGESSLQQDNMLCRFHRVNELMSANVKFGRRTTI